MGQWGLSRGFILPDGGVVTVLPHVDTGERPFVPIREGSVIDELIATNAPSNVHEFMGTLRKQFVGRPYEEWTKQIPDHQNAGVPNPKG